MDKPTALMHAILVREVPLHIWTNYDSNTRTNISRMLLEFATRFMDNCPDSEKMRHAAHASIARLLHKNRTPNNELYHTTIATMAAQVTDPDIKPIAEYFAMRSADSAATGPLVVPQFDRMHLDDFEGDTVNAVKLSDLPSRSSEVGRAPSPLSADEPDSPRKS